MKKLSEAMEILLEDENLRKSMPINCRNKALRGFSISVIVKKHMELYNKILASVILKAPSR
jgi:glycosyltransferase involved in cell wall biosynthesis